MATIRPEYTDGNRHYVILRLQVHLLNERLIMINRSQTSQPLVAVLGSVLLLAHTAVGQSTASRVKMIELSPAWAGSAEATKANVRILNDKGVFKRTWNPSTISAEYNSIRVIPDSNPDADDRRQPNGQPPSLSQDIVGTDDVVALIRALTAPSVNSPSLANLGVTPAWLAEHSSDAAEHFGNLGEPNDERQQAFLRRSFTDLALIGRTIPRVVGGSWTDDPVWVHVLVRFVDGRTIQAETTNQPPFMLPWALETDGKKARTFDADISRSVAKLLPDGSVNKERLQGSGLMREIVFQMDPSIRQQWEKIGAEDMAGDALEHLREKYTIRRTEVSGHISLHFGPAGPEGGGKNLEADVRLPGFPQNLVVATVFPLHDGQAIGVDTFLRNGSHYEHLVLENPWIMDSLKRHKDLGAWLIYVQDASMSEKALKIFAADMHNLGRDDLAQEVSAHRTEIADLSYYGNEVLLFPDHHAILWRWDPNRDLFGWPASRVKTQRCTDYPTLDVGCSAAVVGRDGQLEK